MFKHLITTFMSFAILLTSSFAAVESVNSHGSDFRSLMAEFRYEIEVDWDQNDQVVLGKTLNDFRRKFVELNPSKEEMKAYILSEVRDEFFANRLLELINAQDKAEALKVFEEINRDLGYRGANWSGASLSDPFWIAVLTGYAAIFIGVPAALLVYAVRN